jgi:hypothetical protein
MPIFEPDGGGRARRRPGAKKQDVFARKANPCAPRKFVYEPKEALVCPKNDYVPKKQGFGTERPPRQREKVSLDYITI